MLVDEQDEVIGEEEYLLINATLLSLEDAVQLARSYGALVYPAHIDREANGIIAMLGGIPKEYEFDIFELRDKSELDRVSKIVEDLAKSNMLVCSDAHQLWNISEAENAFMIDDEPYSSALVRKRVFEKLRAGELD